MNISVKMIATSAILKKRGINTGGRVQKYIDSEVLRLCDPLVPKDTSTLLRSGELNTVLGSGVVKYSTPYAQAVYRRAANYRGAPLRGNYWFERMKENGGKAKILAGAKKMAGVK